MNLFHQGNDHYIQGRFNEAKTCYESYLNLNPNDLVAHHNLGLTYVQLEDFHNAIKSFEIPIQNNYVESLIGRGSALRSLGYYKDALLDFAKAFALDPRHATAYSNYGNSLREFCFPDIAIPFLQLAQSLNSNVPNFRLNESIAHLLNGDLIEGWKKYDARWYYQSEKSFKPVLPKIEYDGSQDIKGKRLLVYSEQGFGDAIQFARYLNLLGDATVYFYCRTPLLNLMQYNFPNIQVYDVPENIPEFDYHCALLDLPKIFNTSIDNIPYPEIYLSADIETIKKFKKLLGKKTKPRVGIVWSANKNAWLNRFKKIELETLLKISDTKYDLYNLQPEVDQTEQFLLSNVYDYTGYVNDFMDTAAYIENLDVVVTVDTAVAHLAGALGKKTYVLLTDYAVDWRWFLNRNDSPFYNSVTLVRKEGDGDWNKVVDKLKIQLDNLFDKK